MDIIITTCLISLAVASGLWVIIFKSPLVKHLLNLALELEDDEELYTSTDVENFFLDRDMWFTHNLWVCETCQAVWTAAIAALMVVLAPQLPFIALPIVFLAFIPITKWTQKHL